MIEVDSIEKFSDFRFLSSFILMKTWEIPEVIPHNKDLLWLSQIFLEN